MLSDKPKAYFNRSITFSITVIIATNYSSTTNEDIIMNITNAANIHNTIEWEYLAACSHEVCRL